MVALIAELALPLQHVQRRNELWPLPQPLLLLEEVLVLSWWCDGYEGGCHSAAGATWADGAGAVAALTAAKRQVH